MARAVQSKVRKLKSLLIVSVFALLASACNTMGSKGGEAQSARPTYKVKDVNQAMIEADRAYKAGELARADDIYTAIVQEDERIADAYYRLGNIGFKTGDYAKASENFSKAVELMPRNAKAHYNLAVTYLTLSEQHFKFYTATAPEGADLKRVSTVLKNIYDFANYSPSGRGNNNNRGSQDALDSLADQFK